MEIKEGKRYILRNGIVVKITQINPLTGLTSGVDSLENGYIWNLNGEYACKVKHELDIVSESHFQKQNKMEIQEGKRYILKNGNITGEIDIKPGSNTNSLYSFIDKENCITFTKHGECQYDLPNLNIVSELDIIREYNEMERNICDFSNAKVGDKVWSIQCGDCVISKIRDGMFPIITTGDSTIEFLWYTINGNFRPTDKYPSLYWNNPNIIAPPAPMKNVKKIIEGWLNIYENGKVYFYKSKPEADKAATPFRIDCIHVFSKRMVE